MSSKCCKECNQVKHILEFAISRKKLDGRENKCKQCRNSSKPKRYNPDKKPDTSTAPPSKYFEHDPYYNF